MSAPLIVTCGYILHQGRVLLAKRRESGMWELPGGKQEPGETLPQCLARELHEELGIRVEVLKPLGQVSSQGNGANIQLHCFLCALADGEPQPKEHAALAWPAPEDLRNYKLCPADRELLGMISQAPIP